MPLQACRVCDCLTREAAPSPPAETGRPPDEPLEPAANLTVHGTWESDMAALDEGVRLLFSNAFAKAEATFLKGLERRQRAPPLRPGEHDLSAEFAFNWALASMIRGIALLENKQFDECLNRVRQADASARSAEDASWIGHQIMLGCCLALQGVIHLLQHSFARGAVCLARSWVYLSKAEGHCAEAPPGARDSATEREMRVIRSLSLFICGAVGLIASLLPSSVGGLTQLVVGVPASRELAVRRLETCWQECGLLASWACATALSYHVDVRFFLGEEIGPEEIGRCDAMLRWAVRRHPGSIVFGLLRANLAGLQYRNDEALRWINGCARHLEEAPALGLVIHAQHAKFATLDHRWSEAAAAFDRAADVNIAVGRRTIVPTFSFASALCSIRAGNTEAALARLRRVSLYADAGKKNWPPSDRQSIRKAKAYLDMASRGLKPGGLPPLLDLLEFLELKLHALRRMSADGLAEFLELLDAVQTKPSEAGVEARRLRYGAELARLLGRPAEEVSSRLDSARAAAAACGAGKEAEEAAKDGVEALIHYSAAEAHFARGDFAAARGSCHLMKRSAWRADFWINLAFKAHSLEQRTRCGGGDKGRPRAQLLAAPGAAAPAARPQRGGACGARLRCCGRRRPD